MALLVIGDDNNKYTHNLIDAFISICSENSLILTLQTTEEIIKYSIRSNSEHDNIDDIATFIQGKIDNARKDILPLFIDENPIRYYIHIGNVDVEKSKRFSGNRL